jgi:tetratricopeptide (TPR) repeat protein
VGEAAELWAEAARIAADGGDADTHAAYLWAVAVTRYYIGTVAEGFAALATLRAHCAGDARVGRSALGYSPLSAGLVAEAELLSLRGHVEEARAALDRLINAPPEIAHPEWVIWARSVAPRLAADKAELEACLEACRECHRQAVASGNISTIPVALGGIGIAEIGLGRFADAVGTLEQALTEARGHHTGLFEEGRHLVHLARARLGAGDGDGALGTATEAIDVSRRQGASIVECFALLTRARIRRAIASVPTAITADLETALALARQTGAAAYETEIEAELGAGPAPAFC